MSDTITADARSRNMSRIRSRDTQPERRVRSLLHKMGFRFRLHGADLPGKPDIVLPKYRTVVLVHGCFWHRHRGCPFCYVPKSRVEFWQQKFARNIVRDRTVARELKQHGWQVIVVWECELRDEQEVAQRIRTQLFSGR